MEKINSGQPGQNYPVTQHSTQCSCNNTARYYEIRSNTCNMNSKIEEIGIDRIDKLLLRLMQKDALIGTESLGSAVGLSATAAKRRINKLRQNGTITKDISVVDPKKLGFEVFALVLVNLERDRREIFHSFKLAIRDNPNIIQGFYTTGDADFVLLVASKSLTEYEVFTQDFFWSNPNIKNFKTMIVMDNVKLGFDLPI
jgi:Lrp/AsnC family leucine-responsive transcriptional regulator